jgi:hypothetical protein
VFQSVGASCQRAERDETAQLASKVPLEHSPLHLDLESFYYVLLYLCIPFTVVELAEKLGPQVDSHSHPFNTEMVLENARFVTEPNLGQEHAIGLSDLLWVTKPTSAAAI